jgi:type IV secretion system protein VirD4
MYDPKRFICKKASGHLLTVAPTRAGKGVSLIIPNLLCYRGSAIILDPKGELAWITAPRRRELGQKVCIVDPWDQVNKIFGAKAGVREEVSHFNPLSMLKAGSRDLIDNLAWLADSLIITESKKDPQWDDSARELVSGLMAYVVENPVFAPHASLSLVRVAQPAK